MMRPDILGEKIQDLVREPEVVVEYQTLSALIRIPQLPEARRMALMAERTELFSIMTPHERAILVDPAAKKVALDDPTGSERFFGRELFQRVSGPAS